MLADPASNRVPPHDISAPFYQPRILDGLAFLAQHFGQRLGHGVAVEHQDGGDGDA